MDAKVPKCSGVTANGHQCHMKQNCKRWLEYTFDDEVYVAVLTAPSCIEHTPLECPLKVTAHLE